MAGLGRVRIPEVVVRRLPVYLRVLTDLQGEGVEVVSSAELAERTGFSSEQIRKDLAIFGALGTRGRGYRTEFLRERLLSAMGLDRPVNVALVGAGSLGTALARYTLTRGGGIRLVAVFDNDWGKIGQRIGDVEVRPLADLPRLLPALQVRLAIVAVPAAAAQAVTDLLVENGVQAILNFSPVRLDGRGRAHVQNIDLAIELQSLAYYAVRAAEAREAGG